MRHKDSMAKRRVLRIEPSKAFLYIFMIALVTFTALPLVYLVSTAFKPLDELFIFPPRFFVNRPTLRNFYELIMAMDSSTVPFTRYFFNSTLVTTISVAGSVIVCCAAAYSLAKMKFPCSNAVFTIIIATLMFSPPASQISNYIIVNKLGMINTYWALIIPKLAASYYFFLMRQYFTEIPDELIESAKIDGSNDWTTFTKIVMPIARPAWATVIVFGFVANWNDFFSPLIFINKQAMKTLPLALQMLQGGTGQVARTGAFAASALLTTAPTIIIFMIMQSKVIKTMAHTGIK